MYLNVSRDVETTVAYEYESEVDRFSGMNGKRPPVFHTLAKGWDYL